MPRILNGNVAEIQRLTRVCCSGYMSFIHVSVAAVTAEPDHFFVGFRQVSFEGNTCFC